MNVFQELSVSRFTLNGIEYLKNYVSSVHGDKVVVFNNYERKDTLVELTSYKNYTVNGSEYGSAEALQAALLSVIYNRTTLGGSNIVLSQDNIDVVIYMNFVSDGLSALDVVNSINSSVQTYTVNEQQSIWVNAKSYTVTSKGVSLNNTYIFKITNKGKGVYGAGQKQLSINDVFFVSSNPVSSNDIENDPETENINFGNLTDQKVSEWLNLKNPSFNIQPQDEGYTLFKGNINGQPKNYLFVGNAGQYGLGQPASTEDDFQLLSDVAQPSTPSIDKVLKTGSSTSEKITFTKEAAIRLESGAPDVFAEINMVDSLDITSSTDVIRHNGRYFAFIDDLNTAIESVAGSNPETSDYVSRVKDAGGSLDSKTIQAVDSYITKEKRNGSWSNTKDSGLFLGGTVNSCLVKLVGTADLINGNDQHPYTNADITKNGFEIKGENPGKYISLGTELPNYGLSSQNLSISIYIPAWSTNTASTAAYMANTVPAGQQPSIIMYGGNATFFLRRLLAGTYTGVMSNSADETGIYSSTNAVDWLLPVGPVSIPIDGEITFNKTSYENNETYFGNNTLGFYRIGEKLTKVQCKQHAKNVLELMQDLGRVKPRVNMGAIGDSVTEGNSSYTTYSAILGNLLGYNNFNIGRGGSATKLAFENGAQPNGLTRYKDVLNYGVFQTVIWAYGANDYRGTLPANDVQVIQDVYDSNREIFNAIKDNDLELVVVTPTPNYEAIQGPNINDRVINYVRAIQQVVTYDVKYRVYVVDNFHFIKDLIDAGVYTWQALLPDGVHPSNLCHKLLAENIYEVYTTHTSTRRPKIEVASILPGENTQLDIEFLDRGNGTVTASFPDLNAAGLDYSVYINKTAEYGNARLIIKNRMSTASNPITTVGIVKKRLN
jgi:lysophospholipase L1-like esterase